MARSVGGIIAGVASSTSVINKVDVDGSVLLNTPSGPTPIIGGVVGKNEGSIDQVRFKGEVSTTIAQSFIQDSKQGGIAGYNSNSITNAIVENSALIQFNQIHYAGGVVGYNMGTLAKTLSLGKVISHDKTFSSSHIFAPILAYSGANARMDNSYYLKNMVATYLGTPSPSDIQNGSLSMNQTAGSIQMCDSPISITQANVSNYSYLIPTSNIKADMFSIKNNFYDNQLSSLLEVKGLISGANNMYIFKYLPPYTYNNQLCLPGNTQIDFYKKAVLDPNYTFGELSVADFKNTASFTNFNIAGKDANGNRAKEVEMIGYFKTIMYGQAAPADAPIWQLDGDGWPSLLQLEPFN